MAAPHAPEPPKWLTEAAQVCQNTGVTITIEHQSRVYKIAPSGAEKLSLEYITDYDKADMKL